MTDCRNYSTLKDGERVYKRWPGCAPEITAIAGPYCRLIGENVHCSGKEEKCQVHGIPRLGVGIFGDGFEPNLSREGKL